MFFHDRNGMSLIDVMIAIALFGLIVTTFVNMYGFVSRFNADTLDQLRIAELAHSELEKIKAGNAVPGDMYKPYPNSLSQEQSYYVDYDTNNPIADSNVGGYLYKLTIPHNLTDYKFVTWMPPKKTIIKYSQYKNPYTSGSWEGSITPSPDSDWKFRGSYIERTGGLSGDHYIYYKSPTPYNTFDYTIFLKFSDVGSSHSETGLCFKTYDNSIVNAFYIKGAKVHGNNYEVYLGYKVNSVLQSPYLIDTNVPLIKNIDDNPSIQKYYLRAVGEASPVSKLTLEFGYYDSNGDKITKPEHTKIFSFNDSLNYKLGLYDYTDANVDSRFIFEPDFGGGNDCNI